MISGKEAAIAYLEGKEVLHVNHDFVDSDKWADCKGMGIDDFKNDKWAFKLKPRTITINVPKHTAQHLSGRKVEITFESHRDANLFFNEMQETMYK